MHLYLVMLSAAAVVVSRQCAVPPLLDYLLLAWALVDSADAAVAAAAAADSCIYRKMQKTTTNQPFIMNHKFKSLALFVFQI